MPILIGESATELPTPAQFREMPQVSFTDPLGQVTTFTDPENGWLLQPGPTGLDMPEYAFAVDESPSIDGHWVRQVRAQAKTIVLPIAFWADDSRAAYLARRRNLVRALNPKRGPGRLTVTQPDGEARSIACYYAGGLSGDEAASVAGPRWAAAALEFACPSPYWLGDAVHTEWRVAQTGVWLPVLPLAVRDSQVLGMVTVDNAGDDVAYPVWTITGPATSVTLTNSSTGESLVLTRSITSGDTVVIDTRERQQTALLNGTTNLWPNLSSTSTLWALRDGINDLSLTVLGAGASTLVQLDYQPRYLAA